MSLKKIAELADTSVSTVSRVLNTPGHTCNTPGLAEKIWELAKELNYLPNTSARSLRLGTQETTPPFTVDFFLTRFDSIDKDPFFQELFQYIKEELFQTGCLLGDILTSVDILALEKTARPKELIPYRSSEKVISEQAGHSGTFIPQKANAGLIILGKCPQELVPVVTNRYSCVAGIDRNPTDYAYDEVVCNGTVAAEKAMEYLISLGHKNIAYIGDCTYETRYIGYYQALLNHKIPMNYQNIHPTNQTEEEGYQKMEQILQSLERPSAIFCANDGTALGVLRALKKHKKRGYLPSIISIDNILHSQNTSPMLTTIDIPKREMGHLALSLLLDRKKEAHKEHVRIELPCRLIIRESCNYVSS